MKVSAYIEYCELDNDYGYPVEGVCAVCSRCGHETTAFGVEPESIRYCLVSLREECPKNESNFYVAKNGEDEDL